MTAVTVEQESVERDGGDPALGAGRHRRRLPWREALQLSFWLAVLAVGWLALAPTALGGYDSYVVTDGSSMLPVIHGGGLVVTRSEREYHVGEIVAYRNPQLLNHVVLHQIVAIHDGRYTFKGVNNPEPDLYHPTKAQLLGRKWLYWGNGGRFLATVKRPVIGATILAAVGMFAVADLAKPRRTRSRHRRPAEGDAPPG